MMMTAGDLSLFFKFVKGKLGGMIGAYAEDTIGTRSEKF